MDRQFESGDTITFFVMENRKNQDKTSKSKSLQLLKTHLIPLMVIMNMQQIKKIALELADIHGEKYNDNQFRLWAQRMINKQHDEMDHPNIPLITGGVKKIFLKGKPY